MATNITRFINWLRIDEALNTPVDVVGRSAEGHHISSSAVALAEQSTMTKTSAVVNRLVEEGRIPSTAADAAQAFYALNQRCATHDEIHDIFVTLDELGFIAD